MSDEVEPGFVRVRLDLSYDGKDFSGWAKQAAGRRTVQGEIEDALRTVTRSARDVRADRGGADRRRGARAGAGRACRPAARRCGPSTRRSCCGGSRGGCRRTYGSGARPRRPAGFNARFSAIWRRYAYRVGDHPGGVDPLLRGHVLWHDWPLDVDAMNEAAARLLGRARLRRVLQEARGRDHHPYAAAAELGARTTDGVITATVRADAFCHNMVRSLIGALLFVGDGHRRGRLARRRCWPRACGTRRCTSYGRTG